MEFSSLFLIASTLEVSTTTPGQTSLADQCKSLREEKHDDRCVLLVCSAPEIFLIPGTSNLSFPL